MHMIAFDTLEFSRKLQENGFTREQADSLSDAHKQAFAQAMKQNDLATRQDIAAGVRDLATKDDIALVKDDIAQIRETMATKEDIAQIRETMATKDELAVVKEDIAQIRETMATKDELAQVKEELLAKMATKDELARVCTDLSLEIAAVRIEVKDSHNSVLRWMFGMFLSFAAFLVAVAAWLK